MKRNLKTRFWLFPPLLLLLALPTLAPPQAAPMATTYDLSWNVIAGGGATSTTAGSYTLGATIGQAATGPISGAGYAVYSGFWVVTPGHVLDVDDNGAYDALTDGLLIIRYLFGLTGTSLTSGAIGVGPLRSTPVEIAQYLDNVKPLLDVDGVGGADAFTDGLMLIRYLFGLRGSALTAGAVGAGATRTTPQIEAYIQSLMP
jgi:hypothetical protein